MSGFKFWVFLLHQNPISADDSSYPFRLMFCPQGVVITISICKGEMATVH